MKTIENISNMHNQEDSRYLKLLCEQKSDVVLKTEFGIGHYDFVEFKEYDGDLVLEFQLMKDHKFKDTININQHIGNCCFLTIGQYLYAYSNNACA